MPDPHAPLRHPAALAVLAALLQACASPAPLVMGPLAVPPPVPAQYVESTPNGAIFQTHMAAETLFSPERRPQRVGDTMSVEIQLATTASSRSKTDAARKTELAAKGPGNLSKEAVLAPLWNLDAQASGSNDFKGNGSADTESRFDGQLTVSVINVMPNGHLLVAGERALAVNGERNHLRFSGLVNPRDIRRGNVVSAAQVANAAIEMASDGAIGDATRRSWMQRVLTRSLSVW
jgi:flagellar L-ring protein precursor FlgH